MTDSFPTFATQTEIYDVFLIDSSFEIERPLRIYHQGLQLFTHAHHDDNEEHDDDGSSHNAGLPANEKPKCLGGAGVGDPLDPSTTDVAIADSKNQTDSSNRVFFLKSSDRKLKLIAKTERQQDQFIASIERMTARTIWAGQSFSYFERHFTELPD
jgi:phospholipase D1/2